MGINEELVRWAMERLGEVAAPMASRVYEDRVVVIAADGRKLQVMRELKSPGLEPVEPAIAMPAAEAETKGKRRRGHPSTG